MRRAIVLMSVILLPSPLLAQHVHTAGMSMSAAPTQPGQDAYAAIAEVVQMLQADSNTDWSKVNIEALRQHLVDMNLVTLNSAVRQENVPGGLRMDITGDARTAGAITRMVSEHAHVLDAMPDYAAAVATIPNGVRLTVQSRHPDDTSAVEQIRGLGFIGLLTVGAHHGPHHLALATGQPMMTHH